MSEYLARYTVNAYMFDGGAWMSDPEFHKPEYRFKAKNDEQAKKIARNKMATFREKYFFPSSTLDSLLKIEEVKL